MVAGTQLAELSPAGVRDFIQVSHMGGKDPNTWAIFCRFSQAAEGTAGEIIGSWIESGAAGTRTDALTGCYCLM